MEDARSAAMLSAGSAIFPLPRHHNEGADSTVTQAQGAVKRYL
jgi:hypothetical protein